MTCTRPCPCGQPDYTQCCEPFHLNKANAQTAEQLMRSRYSAFALQQIDYLIATTATGQQALLDRTALESWSKQNTWQRLEVLKHIAKVDKNHACVEFKAYYHDGQHDQIHHEISYFVQLNQRWYFLDPTLDMNITMKQACICGSGKKFKQCCAQYL